MNASEVTDVCRLCPSSGGAQNLLNVFDKTISFKYGIREVISMNTGIEIMENDLVSKKICQRCCNILYKMFEFRLDALKQDKKLKDKCSQLLEDKGIKLPNTCITIKREKLDAGLTTKTPKTEPGMVVPSINKELKKRLHPSVADIYRNYPDLKLPTKCFDRHIAPVVSFIMGEVENYFKKRKLDMNKYIYKPKPKSQLSPKVAKKKTSFLAREKTVAPLKISKKLIQNHKEASSSSDSSYIYTWAPTQGKGTKRKLSSTEVSADSKLSRNSETMSLPVLKSVVETKPIISKLNVIKTTNLDSNSVPTSPAVVTPSPVTPSPVTPSPVVVAADKKSEDIMTPLPELHPDHLSEDSRDSCSTNISTLSNDPEFPQSLGLIPTVTATKSHRLLVCNLCGTVHHNAYELKKHMSRHMVCQFCKQKFKSFEAKQCHVDMSCQIKQIMNSSGPSVALERIHFNLDIRKKYPDAFANFELIPGLVEPTPVEQVILEAASPPPWFDDVIVLSDEDDETPTKSADPLSGIPTPAANMPSPALENVVYNTVSIVRPDIRIKNNTILNSLVENMTDNQLLKDLIAMFKPPQPTIVEKMIQTDLPASKDIKINNSEGTCEFKNLRGQLESYKIPITISNGPFHIGYQFKGPAKTNKSMAMWSALPVIDVCKKVIPKPSIENNNTTPSTTCSSTPSLLETSQVNTVVAAVSSESVITNSTTKPVVLISSSTIPMVTAVTSSSCFVTAPPLLTRPVEVNPATDTVTNPNIIPIITSNSATPLLQNYALSMITAPVISNPIPIPRTYINSALSNTATISNRTMSTIVSNNSLSRPLPTLKTSYNPTIVSSNSLSSPLPTLTTSYNPTIVSSNSLSRPLPTLTTSYNPSLLKSNPDGNRSDNVSVLTPLNLSPVISDLSNVILIPSSTTVAPVQPANNLPASTLGNTSSATSQPSETSKFRVKSVWELQ